MTIEYIIVDFIIKLIALLVLGAIINIYIKIHFRRKNKQLITKYQMDFITLLRENSKGLLERVNDE